VSDVLRVVGAWLGGEAELGANERCRHFGDNFLGCVLVPSKPRP